MSLTYVAYKGLIDKLVEVSHESSIKNLNTNHFNLSYPFDLKLNKYFYKNITKNVFLLYESAKRLQDAALIDFFLERCVEKIEKNERKIFGKNINEEILKITKKIIFPRFENKDAFESEMMKALKTGLSKEIIYRKFHENEATKMIPKHAEAYLKKEKIPLLENYFSARYGHLIRVDNRAFNMTHITYYSAIQWNKEIEYLKKSLSVQFEKNSFCYLIDQFVNDPSIEAVQFLLLFKNKIGFNLKMLHLVYDEIIRSLSDALFTTFIKVDESTYKFLIDILLSLGEKEKNRDVMFFNILTLGRKILKKQVTANHYEMMVNLLQILIDKKFHLISSIAEDISKKMEHIDLILFYSYSDTANYLIRFKIFNELFLMISHFAQLQKTSYLNSLTSSCRSRVVLNKQYNSLASSQTIFTYISTNYNSGPYYSILTPLLVSYALVLKIQKISKREEVLKNILIQFTDYNNSALSEILPYILLGVLTKSKIPLSFRGTVLEKYLLEYKGVFFEDIDEGIKMSFWENLVKGRLGGLTTDLVDALSLFFHTTENEGYKQKAKNALKKIAGIESGSSAGRVAGLQVYARNMFFSLS